MILFTSDTDKYNPGLPTESPRTIKDYSATSIEPPINCRRGLLIYLCISTFCLVTFLVYDQFSHNVRSPFMTFLFLWPLLMGALPAFWLLIIPAIPRPKRFTLNLYNSGVAALTVSSVMRGVFEIAGTSSPFQTGLMIAGTLMWVGGVLCYIISIIRS